MSLKSRLLPLALLPLLLAAALPAAAQNNWYLYLYQVETGELVRLNADGSTQSYSIGLAPGTYVGARQMAFTPDGSRVAFCAVTYAQDPAANQTRLIVRDILAQTNLVDADLGAGIGCESGPHSFNENYSQLAVGKVNYMPGQPGADASRPSWQVLVLDAASGALVASLDQPAEVNLSQPEAGTLLPLVRSFSGTTITFNPVMYATDMNPNLLSYRWDYAAGTITPDTSGRYAAPGVETLPTGESVWIAENAALPSAEPFGPMPRYNVVMAMDASGAPRVIYHNGAETITDVAFIDDGARLGIVLQPSVDFNAPVPNIVQRYVAFDRAGNVTDLGGGQAVYIDLFGLPGGYGALELFIAEGGLPRMRLTASTGGAASVLWSGEGGWEVAFTPPLSAAPGLTPFAELLTP